MIIYHILVINHCLSIAKLSYQWYTGFIQYTKAGNTNMANMSLTMAHDLGNGYVKSKINGKSVKFPSIEVLQRRQDIKEPINFKTSEDEQNYMVNLMDHLDLTIDTPATRNVSQVLIGNAAVNSSLHTDGFDVNSLSGKSDTDLAIHLTLATIAGYVLKTYYDVHKNRPASLDVEVDIVTALPIMEGKKQQVTQKYEERYLNHQHKVTFKNFTEPITVNIKFNRVIVALEGEAAQYKIKNATGGLLDALKQDFDTNYPDMAQSVTADQITKVGNVLGVDIGEGTTDFAVFTDGQINTTASTSVQVGYGNALEEAIAELQSNGFNVNNRAELQKLLNRQTDAFAAKRQDVARTAVKEQLNTLSNNITRGLSNILRHNSSSIDVIYVYGGGATPMLSYLRGEMIRKVKSFTNDIDTPIIWINSQYAQTLNEDGLDYIANRIFKG